METMYIRKATQGDARAFEALIRPYERKVYNMALRMFHQEADAWDAAQEILLKAYRNLPGFKFESSFSTWLYRVAANTCIDLYRKQKRKRERECSLDQTMEERPDGLHRLVASKGDTPEEALVRKETILEVHRAIEALSPDHRMVIVLRDLQGLGYKEIADILECSEGTVKSRISRARESLKRILLENREQTAGQIVP
nr:sigma-70 family RNA polymerase sigma factor [Anaerotalea alkaliphila]